MWNLVKSYFSLGDNTSVFPPLLAVFVVVILSAAVFLIVNF